MSVTLTSKPYAIDFAFNDLFLEFLSNPVWQTGKPYVAKWRINQMPSSGVLGSGVVRIAIYGTTYAFYAQTLNLDYAYRIPFISPGTDAYKIKAVWDEYIINDYQINQYFKLETSIEDGYCYVTFTSIANTSQAGIVSMPTTVLGEFSATKISEKTGLEERRYDNHAIWVKLKIQTNSESWETQEMFLQVNSNARARMSLNMLRAYFTQIDLPDMNLNISYKTLINCYLKFQVMYAEIVDNAIRKINQSNDIILLPGKMQLYNRQYNIPDWISPFNRPLNNKIYSYVGVRNLGCDNGLTVVSYFDAEQFVYFMNFNDPDDKQLYIYIDIVLNNGKGVQLRRYPGIMPKNAIFRMSISASSQSLGDYDMAQYTVRIARDETETGWSRTFIIKQKPYTAQSFLLQNRHGMLESFFSLYIKKKKEIEGENIILDNERELDISNSNIVYTASTGPKGSAEIRLLSEAYERKFNYINVGSRRYMITIIPGSLDINDTSLDIQEASFDFMISKSEEDINMNDFVDITSLIEDEKINCQGYVLADKTLGDETLTITQDYNQTEI